MLSILGKLTDEDAHTAAMIFDRFDSNGDGTLSASELEMHRQDAKRRDTVEGVGVGGSSGGGAYNQPTFTYVVHTTLYCCTLDIIVLLWKR